MACSLYAATLVAHLDAPSSVGLAERAVKIALTAARCVSCFEVFVLRLQMYRSLSLCCTDEPVVLAALAFVSVSVDLCPHTCDMGWLGLCGRLCMRNRDVQRYILQLLLAEALCCQSCSSGGTETRIPIGREWGGQLNCVVS